jgi:hypothetical protein
VPLATKLGDERHEQLASAWIDDENVHAAGG